VATEDPSDEGVPEAADPALPLERRSHPRTPAHIPVRVVRVTDDGQIAADEETHAEDLGPGGTRLATSLPLLTDERIWIEERSGGFASWGAVRTVTTGSDGLRRVGIEFLPGAGGPPSPRRGYARLGARVAVVITRQGADGTPGESEQTFTENISPGGARVLTRLESIRRGEVVTLGEAASRFETRARVANAWRGSDGQRHLNLEFEEPLPL
jgi:hypothetical protein